jgi:hypothetical protein
VVRRRKMREKKIRKKREKKYEGEGSKKKIR